MPACNSKKNYCLTVVATKINMLQKYHFFLKNFNIFAHFFLSLQFESFVCTIESN